MVKRFVITDILVFPPAEKSWALSIDPQTGEYAERDFWVATRATADAVSLGGERSITRLLDPRLSNLYHKAWELFVPDTGLDRIRAFKYPVEFEMYGEFSWANHGFSLDKPWRVTQDFEVSDFITSVAFIIKPIK